MLRKKLEAPHPIRSAIALTDPGAGIAPPPFGGSRPPQSEATAKGSPPSPSTSKLALAMGAGMSMEDMVVARLPPRNRYPLVVGGGGASGRRWAAYRWVYNGLAGC